MRRPRTIPGLLWLWLRMRPRRLIAVAVVAVAALGAAVSWTSGSCPVESDAWSAGLGEYDYVQTLSLRSDGTGEYAYGYAQAMRFEARFRYRVLDGERLELRDFVELDENGREHELAWPPQRVSYELREGRYCFRPPYGEERCRRCQLTLGSSPLPGGYDDYYACDVR